MLNVKKILLPLDLEESALPVLVIRQAAALAHHFHAEMLVLHVIRPLSYMAGSNTARERIDRDVASENEKLKECLGSELNGLSVRRSVVKGDPAHEILRTVGDEKIDLIVMPTHGYGEFERFLVGPVTAKVLHNGECPVWTVTHLDEVPGEPLAIRNVLCAVDFSAHSAKTIRSAQDVANEFGAKLALAHVTPGVEIYGPGGYHVLSDMKRELVDGAKNRMANLQQELGTRAEVFIGSGDVPKIMSQAAKQAKADLLVVGCRSLQHRFGNTAYGIIRDAHVPVLSV